MSRTSFDTLLEAGCHFGHLKRKWNPAMAPYIFMERNGIHIIDLHKTVAKIDEAAEALKAIAKQGKRVLFVATKKQAKDVVADKAASVNMPYVTERWPGGMLTNTPGLIRAPALRTGCACPNIFYNLQEPVRTCLGPCWPERALSKNPGGQVLTKWLSSGLFVRATPARA